MKELFKIANNLSLPIKDNFHYYYSLRKCPANFNQKLLGKGIKWCQTKIFEEHVHPIQTHD